MAVRLVASQKQSFYLALPDERDSNKIEHYDVKASPIQYGMRISAGPMCTAWEFTNKTKRYCSPSQRRRPVLFAPTN
jgi:hypothetical protein